MKQDSSGAPTPKGKIAIKNEYWHIKVKTCDSGFVKGTINLSQNLFNTKIITQNKVNVLWEVPSDDTPRETQK